MSDVFAERRPMVDLDEFEKRLWPPRSADPKNGDALAELLRIIGSKGAPNQADLEAKARPDAGETGERKQAVAQVCRFGGDFAAIEAGLLGMKHPQPVILPEAEKSPVEYKRPNTRVPLISGDFAAIEAGLLGALQEQTTATVSETDVPSVLPSVDFGAQRWLFQERKAASCHVDAARQIRSWRPVSAVVAIGIAGMVGIAVSFGLNSRVSGPHEIATIRAESRSTKQQTEVVSGADIPAQDVAILGKPPEPAPVPIVNGIDRPLDLLQGDEKSPPAESQARIDNEPPAVPPTPAGPLSTATPVESKTDLVQRDGTLLPSGAPPQANIDGAPLSASQSSVAVKASPSKVAEHAARPRKLTARHPGSTGQPRQIANKAAATPGSPPITNSKAEAPTTEPSLATNGAIGFVQSAVNSLTSTTTKLMEWGRH